MANDRRPPLRDPALLGGLGLVLGATTVGGALLGYYCDGRWGTGPWLTFLGTLLGTAVGFAELLRALRRLARD